MVGPPFSQRAGGRPFFRPWRLIVDGTTILVIALAVLFFSGMGTLVLISNLPPRNDPTEKTKKSA